MVLHINLRDKAPPFKGGDPVFESRVSFICGGSPEAGDKGLKNLPGWVRIPFATPERKLTNIKTDSN